MEFVGEPRPSGACNLLEVPGLSSLDVDDDEGEVVIGIRPKSSPLPRRRTSTSDEDSEPEPALCRSRRVSFADTKGLSLVQVKQFDTWDIPKLPGYDSVEGECKDPEEYYLSPLFSLPLSSEELFMKVREQKVELETIELLPRTTILKGVVRVLNISFDKVVYIRTTLDAWSSHFDLLAEYIPGSSDGVTDCFLFKLTLVPPFGEQGVRVDFCLRYETPVGTFWANNDNKNYMLFCHQRVKESKEKPHKENICKKSCLKAVSQNFPAVENMLSLENSTSQENVSTGVSKHGEVANMNSQQISDSQSGTSEEDHQKLLIESSQNCSRRSRRRAARLTRARDYFAQRDGEPNDKESKMPLREATQTPDGQNPLEMHTNVSEMQSISAEHSKMGASESLASSSKSSPFVQYETSPAHDSTSKNESEESERINMADSASLEMSGKDKTDIPNNPLHSNDKPAPSKHQIVNKSVSKAENNSQGQMESSREGMDDESTPNTGELDGNVSSAESIEGLVSQASCFTFGTVVAPLYHQVFGRVGSESQNVADWGNPMRGRVNMGDSATTQNYPHAERKETISSDSADASRNQAEILGDLIKTKESDQECIDTTLNHPHTKRKETSLSASADASWIHAEILQDPAEIHESDQGCTDTPKDRKPFSEEALEHPRTLNILNTDLLKTHIPRESPFLQGKAQEDNLTHDLHYNNVFQKLTRAETAQFQLPEDASSQIIIQMNQNIVDATLSHAQTPTDTIGIQPPVLLSQIVSVHASAEMNQQPSSGGATDCECVGVSHKKDDIHTTVTVSPTDAYSEQEKPSEALQDLDPSRVIDSTTTEPDNSSTGDQNIPVSSVEKVEEKLKNTAHVTSLETAKEPNNVEERNEMTDNSLKDETKCSAENEDGGEVAEPMTKAMTTSHHTHSDILVEFKDEDTLKEKPIMSEKEEHNEIKDIVTKQEDVDPGETTEEKNWEMMVEDEEENLLRGEEESEEIKIKEEAVEEEEGGLMEEQLEDTGIEKVDMELEGMEEEEKVTDEEMVEEIVAAVEEEEEVKDVVGIEDKEHIEEAEMEEIVAGEEVEDVETQLENDVEEMQKEKIMEEGTVEKIVVWEEEVERELEEEEDVVAMTEDDIQGPEIQDEEEIEGDEEEMEIDMIEEDEPDGEWEDEVNPQEKKMEEEIPDYEEEMLVDEEGEEELVGEEAEDNGEAIDEREEEVGGLVERSDGIQNKVEDDLSTSVSNVHDGVGERVIDKENTGEGENVKCGSTEMHLYTEEDDQSNNEATHERSKAVHHSERHENDSIAADGGSCIVTDEPESDQISEGSTSAESLSDDEVELYMYCLRAAQRQSRAQVTMDRNKDIGLGKRPPISRGKQLPSPMPSISESVDEEQHPSSIQHNQKDVETEGFQPTAAALPAASGQESINRNVAWWKGTFSCSNISKTLLYTTLLVVFLGVAYHYDFLACFGLYLISVFWLCCQGEKQPVKNNNRISAKSVSKVVT